MSLPELDEAPLRDDEHPGTAPEGRPARPVRDSGPRRRALLRRRFMALFIGLVLLALLVIGTRSCLDARQNRALSEYARDVDAVSIESAQQSRSLFGLLRGGGGKEAVEIQSTVNGFRAQADLLLDRARALDAPDPLASANRFLVYALEFRRDGLARLAAELPTALGEEGREAATDRITRNMRNFLASDVLFSQRVAPQLHQGLRQLDLAAEAPPARNFLPAISWLEASTVSERLAALREGPGEAGAAARELALGVVTAGGETLSESSPVQVTAAQDLAFSVQVENDGAVPEEEVKATVSITGGPAPLAVERTLESIPAGGSETVTLPLADTPPTGRPVTVEVRVDSAEGEGRTDDNRSSFPATFVPG
jgi:CARDB